VDEGYERVMAPEQKQKKPWQKPEIRVLDLTAEQRAKQRRHHVRAAEATTAAK